MIDYPLTMYGKGDQALWRGGSQRQSAQKQPHRLQPAEDRLRILAITCALVLWITYAYLTATPGILDRTGAIKGRDFPQFYTIGALLWEGRGDLLQDEAAMTAWLRQHLPHSSELRLVPVYGPQVAAIFAPLAALPYGAALWVWSIVSAILYALSCLLVFRETESLRGRAATVWLMAVGSPGLFLTIYYGHLSSAALLCYAAGYAALKQGKPVLAGIALGSLAYKPTLGLVVGLAFLASRQWRVVGGALLAVGLQAAVAVTAAGPRVAWSYLQRLANLAADPSPIQSRNVELNQSLSGLLDLVTRRHDTVTPVFAAAAVVVLGITFWVWKRSRLPLEVRYALLLLSTVLASPHFFVYDLVTLMAPILLLLNWAFSLRADRRQAAVLVAVSLLYVAPLLGLFLAIKLQLGNAALIVGGVFLYVATLALPSRPKAKQVASDVAVTRVATSPDGQCVEEGQ